MFYYSLAHIQEKVWGDTRDLKNGEKKMAHIQKQNQKNKTYDYTH